MWSLTRFAHNRAVPTNALAPMSIAATPAERATRLRHMKTLATALLLACAALLAVALTQHRVGLWDWVAAFAGAALVGALADWFAVVALFRQPLGLPFPHTAIIPRKKAQLADQLGSFIRDRFLDTAMLITRLRGFDPIRRLGDWLVEPAHAQALGGHLQGVLAEVVACLDDPRVRETVQRAVTARLEGLDLSRSASDLLETLTAQGRHQALFGQALQEAADHVETEPVQQLMASMLLEIAGREYPMLLRGLAMMGKPEDFGLKLGAATARGLAGWLREVHDDPQHPRRLAFDKVVADWIERLRTDPEFAARVNEAKLRWLHAPALQAQVRGLWDELRRWLLDDLATPGSRLSAQMGVVAQRLGQTLQADGALRAALQEHLETAVTHWAPALRDGAGEHIARTVRDWPDEVLVQELELGVGRDLQFIRLNGTVVGGLIGLALHLLERTLG
jgi:uncharacterized membrane-anchored protein YjiN (DUF445 family)